MPSLNYLGTKEYNHNDWFRLIHIFCLNLRSGPWNAALADTGTKWAVWGRGGNSLASAMESGKQSVLSLEELVLNKIFLVPKPAFSSLFISWSAQPPFPHIIDSSLFLSLLFAHHSLPGAKMNFFFFHVQQFTHNDVMSWYFPTGLSFYL